MNQYIFVYLTWIYCTHLIAVKIWGTYTRRLSLFQKCNLLTWFGNKTLFNKTHSFTMLNYKHNWYIILCTDIFTSHCIYWIHVVMHMWLTVTTVYLHLTTYIIVSTPRLNECITQVRATFCCISSMLLVWC